MSELFDVPPDNPSTNAHPSTPEPSPWWESLHLAVHFPDTDPRQHPAPRGSLRGVSAHDVQRQRAHIAALRSAHPVAFEVIRPDGTTAHLTFEAVLARTQAAVSGVDASISKSAQERSRQGRVAMEAALNAPDSDAVVAVGDWEGFPRGRARAWCWNLYQYEPAGFVMPASILRAKRIKELEAGGLPDGFEYAHRARELEARGVTPLEYRNAREALGSPTFSPDDVKHSVL